MIILKEVLAAMEVPQEAHIQVVAQAMDFQVGARTMDFPAQVMDLQDPAMDFQAHQVQVSPSAPVALVALEVELPMVVATALVAHSPIQVLRPPLKR